MAETAQAPDSELSLSERELFERVGWFTLVRWGAGCLAFLFLALGWVAFRVRFDIVPAAATISVMFGYNAIFVFWARRLHRALQMTGRRIRTLAHAQMICDLLTVAALVHFIGGVENHFILLFLFPMIVASEFFSPGVAYGYATGAAILINGIGWGEYFGMLPHRPLLVLQEGGGTEPLVAGATQHWMFDLQVCVVMTFAVYATVFTAASIADRLRRRERELESAHNGLRALEQAKSQFMLKASHELRSPVDTIRSLLQAALSLPPGDAGTQDLLERAIGRCRGMADLIDDLLQYSRLRMAAPAAVFGTVDLAEIAQSSVDMFRAQAQARTIHLDMDVRPVRVRGERNSLSDLVNNLISNAIRYTPPCGRISVVVTCDAHRGLLEVSDTGIGIAAEELPHIFDEFFRGREAKKIVPYGTGLGMSIVRRVVEMHGWDIRTESAAGKGTTFRISMPCTRQD